MKKKKIRLWVKATLLIIVVIGVAKIYTSFYEKELNICIETGHSEKYCKNNI